MCQAKAFGPGSPNGSVFVESGREPLEVRNLSSTDTATVVATLVAPNSALDILRAEGTVRCR